MTIKRLLILQVTLVGLLGAVFFLPKVANSTPQGIELALPADIGNWYGVDQKVSEKELEMLPSDTSFARKLYTDGRGGEVFASIVLSGRDLDSSIHRPERCLPAQGWSVADSRVVQIPVQRDGKDGTLATTRLHNVRQVPTSDGRTISIYNLNYYWFVGWKDTTPSHFRRTYIDIRDRVLYGLNQRWAYITVASQITKGLTSFGRSEEETDAMVQDFIRQLIPHMKRPPDNAEDEKMASN